MLENLKKIAKKYRDQAQYSMQGGCEATASATYAVNKSALFLPPADPGSLGDDAMLSGATNFLQERLDYKRFGLAVYSPNSDPFNFEIKLEKEYFWSNWKKVADAAPCIGGYSSLLVMGADVMDGLYSYPASIRRIRYARLAANMGLKSRVLGFSFNENPHPLIIKELQSVKEDVVFCLRDPYSFERIKKFANVNAQLVADMAFLAIPSTNESEPALVEFIKLHRSQGKKIIGINIHSLFNKIHGEDLSEKMAKSIANLVEKHQDCAFVLMPHDYRSGIDDRIALQGVSAAVSVASTGNVFAVTSIYTATEIKKLCAYLDGVFTGRMHLAIAALGQGVPVAGIVYQGKFEGLLAHFELAPGLTIAPADVTNQEKTEKFFKSWLARLEHDKTQVLDRLPEVKKLSEHNFIGL